MKSYLPFALNSVLLFSHLGLLKADMPQLIPTNSQSQCPVFKCAPDDRMDGMDLCFK